MPFVHIPPAATLRAYREDGTVVLPGETIEDFRGELAVFFMPTRANDASRDGKIQLYDEHGQEVYARCYGLHVGTLEGGPPGTPARRDLAAILAASDAMEANYHATYSERIDIFRELAEAVRTQLPVPARDAPEVAAALTVVDETRAELLRANAEPGEAASERDAYLGALAILADAVRDQLAALTDTAELAAEAVRLAQTSAPPVPGITRHAGYTVYAVLPAGDPGVWYVAAIDDQLNHGTWITAGDPDTQRLIYEVGHYHSHGEGAASAAITDLAKRAGIFAQLTQLAAGMTTREAWRESREQALDTLADTYNVGRAKARAGIDEATALGSAVVTWHERGQARQYTVDFDRVACTYTVRRGT